MYEGTIRNVVVDRGFGFITSPGNPDCFFHCKDLDPAMGFDEQLREMRVKFDFLETAKGLRAVNVRPA